ncbi:50S ribosomal protein L10 [Mycoplasma zalophidermidis]|uniref:Large ribosomal subunit protein uL10 n=1 Tax=Mycoplasma zalophidermidis TaxID=398174 RepID=A0ABS6DSF1_9MOLU|nr:50S ribosomal protein L10 [Mycoplasma zalophidermidis]MBU4689892.1 50S ribosomal protein L10 [Mycoplasma zalophidermidis]MBU4693817.1 50S ribosomal protein L10 [Mycoplasma zalophidermidis]MCR8966823.1 50S ribosomal protein L10 [Mycoplasma zalophidermidis]
MNAKESKFKLMKKEQAKMISKKIKNTKGLVVAEYRGLSVAELTELRVEAKKAGVELVVFKNRIFKYALKDTDFESLGDHLVGPNIYAFSNEDELAAAKVLNQFAKTNKLLVLKAGIFEGKVIDAKGVAEVASLPNYEEALGILARSLIAPLQQLSLSLKLYSEKESE